jgi:hypothetical protein
MMEWERSFVRGATLASGGRRPAEYTHITSNTVHQCTDNGANQVVRLDGRPRRQSSMFQGRTTTTSTAVMLSALVGSHSDKPALIQWQLFSYVSTSSMFPIHCEAQRHNYVISGRCEQQ